MNDKKINQKAIGDHNIQVGGNNIQAGGNVKANIYEITNSVFNIVNVSLSDVKTFEKVLLSIEPENFISEVVQPYLKEHFPKKKLNRFIEQLEGIHLNS